MSREPLRTLRMGAFSASEPPRDFHGVTYTPGRAQGYTVWLRGKFAAIAATESEAWTVLTKGAKP